MRLAPLVLILLSLPAVADMLYRWTDADGKVHYTDQPPPASAKNINQKNYKSGSPESAVQAAIQQASLKNPVALYVSTNCGTPCERAKAHLARRGISYTSKDLAVDTTARDVLREDGSPAQAPVLMVGSQILEGYDEAAWDAALNKAGYPPAESDKP